MDSCLNPLYYDVPEYWTVNQNNKIFRANEKSGIPFLAIHKAIKYGYISYDFIALDYVLKPEAVHEIEVIFKDMSFDPRAKTKDEYCNFNPISGFSPNMQLEACREYSLKIRDIVMDKSNWKLNHIAEKYKKDLKALMEQGG